MTAPDGNAVDWFVDRHARTATPQAWRSRIRGVR